MIRDGFYPCQLGTKNKIPHKYLARPKFERDCQWSQNPSLNLFVRELWYFSDGIIPSLKLIFLVVMEENLKMHPSKHSLMKMVLNIISLMQELHSKMELLKEKIELCKKWLEQC